MKPDLKGMRLHGHASIASADEIVLMAIATARPSAFGNSQHQVAIRSFADDISESVKRLRSRQLVEVLGNGELELTAAGLAARDIAFGKRLPQSALPF